MAERYDIIADIHGDMERMDALLRGLGYGPEDLHPEGHVAVFLGDFIDRGTDGLGVLRRVDRMISSGSAIAIMGNHELNALLYHTDDGNGDGLRKRDKNNTRQHGAFLAQCPLGSREAAEAIAIISRLPLFAETEDFRAVHACWSGRSVSDILAESPDGRLKAEHLMRVALEDPEDRFAAAVTSMTKGPEIRLKEGYYLDSHGSKRKKARIRWWDAGPDLHSSIVSIPDLSNVPNGARPAVVDEWAYLPGMKPVLFGHYQLDAPVVTGHAICLDAPRDPAAMTWRAGASSGSLYRPGDPDPDIAPSP